MDRGTGRPPLEDQQRRRRGDDERRRSRSTSPKAKVKRHGGGGGERARSGPNSTNKTHRGAADFTVDRSGRQGRNPNSSSSGQEASAAAVGVKKDRDSGHHHHHHHYRRREESPENRRSPVASSSSGRNNGDARAPPSRCLSHSPDLDRLDSHRGGRDSSRHAEALSFSREHGAGRQGQDQRPLSDGASGLRAGSNSSVSRRLREERGRREQSLSSSRGSSISSGTGSRGGRQRTRIHNPPSPSLHGDYRLDHDGDNRARAAYESPLSVSDSEGDGGGRHRGRGLERRRSSSDSSNGDDFRRRVPSRSRSVSFSRSLSPRQCSANPSRRSLEQQQQLPPPPPPRRWQDYSREKDWESKESSGRGSHRRDRSHSRWELAW